MHTFIYSADVASATIGLVSVLFLALVVELRLKPREGRADRIVSNIMVIGIGVFVALDFMWNLISVGTGGSRGLTASLELVYTYALVLTMTVYITVRAITRSRTSHVARGSSEADVSPEIPMLMRDGEDTTP
jgi:hypothetical protein